MLKRLFCLLVLFLTFQHCFSQLDSSFQKNVLSYMFDYHRGKMMKIYDASPTVTQSQYFNVGVYWNTKGNRYWHSAYGYPQIGLNSFYSLMGNDSILGRTVALCPTMIMKIRSEKRWGGYIKMGSGFAYFFKPYDRIDNSKNEVIGSHITNITNLGVGAFLKITNAFSLRAGYSVFHFSTGHVTIPNYGFNDLAWNIGIEYKKGSVIRQLATVHKTENRIRPNMRVSIGFHELSGTDSPNGGPLYPVYTFSPFVSKHLGKVSNLRLGLCAKYFTAYHDFMLSEDYFRGNENRKAWVLSVFAGNEWNIGKIGFLLEPSLKFYNPFFQHFYVDNSSNDKANNLVKRWFSIKSGFAFYVKQNVSIGLYINTNKTQADFVDIGINYRF